MLSRLGKPIFSTTSRNFVTTAKKNVKVAVLGAAGGIGQPLSLLLKQSPLISRLNLYDIRGTIGVAADISHIETPAKVCGYNGKKFLPKALEGVDIVCIPAGSPRKPGMTRDDLFDINASILAELVEGCAKHCPKAIIGVVTNPVNSVVPIACEVMKKHNVFDPRKVFGITTLDLSRANTFLAEMHDWDPMDVDIPVICGHSGVTIIPLLSQCRPPVKLTDKQAEEFYHRVQDAGTQVVKAKVGFGSAQLAMAYSGARLILSLIRGMKGQKNVIECVFARSNCVKGVDYFAGPVVLGKHGYEKSCGIPKLNAFEKKMLEKAMPDLKKNIQRGVDFVKNQKKGHKKGSESSPCKKSGDKKQAAKGSKKDDKKPPEKKDSKTKIEVVKAKEGAGSATLSMAFAASRFIFKIAKAMKGEPNIVECAYVQSDVVPGAKYFANPLQLGKEGVEKNLGLPALAELEQKLLDVALPELQKEIEKGEVFSKKYLSS